MKKKIKQTKKKNTIYFSLHTVGRFREMEGFDQSHRVKVSRIDIYYITGI